MDGKEGIKSGAKVAGKSVRGACGRGCQCFACLALPPAPVLLKPLGNILDECGKYTKNALKQAKLEYM